MPECVSTAPRCALSAAEAPERGSRTRIVVIDALRGLALTFMALEHASMYARVNTQAEHYLGRQTTLWQWPFWIPGLVTNMAAPAFWLLAGVSIALLEAGYRRKQRPESAITRFLLIRAGALIFLDVAVIGFLWGIATKRLYCYDFDVLTSLGVSLVVLSGLRRVPSWLLAALSLAVLVGYQWFVMALHPDAAEGAGFWAAMWLNYSSEVTPAVRFPVLGWCGLMGLGLVLGRHVSRRGMPTPRTWTAAGLSLLTMWFLIRWNGGYGNFVPYDPGTSWRFFLVLSKGPPSLDFMTLNLGLAAFAFAAFSLRPDLLQKAPLRWLVACGQASLFFYVLHYAVFLVIGKLGAPLLSLGGIARYWLLYAIGMTILIPLAIAYRKLKKRHPESVLKYL